MIGRSPQTALERNHDTYTTSRYGRGVGLLAILKASELMSPNEMGYDALLDRLYEEELDKLEHQTEGE